MTNLPLENSDTLKNVGKKLTLEEALRLVPLDKGQKGNATLEMPHTPKAQKLSRSAKKGWRGALLLASSAVIVGAAMTVWPKMNSEASAPNVVVKQAQTIAAMQSPVANIPSSLTASGYVVARRKAAINSPVSGRVQSIYVKEGQQVKTGDLIAKLDSSVARSAKSAIEARQLKSVSEVDVVDAELHNARISLSRFEDLSLAGFARQKDLDAARAKVEILEARKRQAQSSVIASEADVMSAKIGINQYNIYAPFDGSIISINAYEGEFTSPLQMNGRGPTDGLVSIIDMNSLEVDVDIAEAYLSRLNTGDPVEISLAAYPGLVYSGEVQSIVPIADRSKATFTVRVRVLDRDERMLPEMVATVKFFQKKELE